MSRHPSLGKTSDECAATCQQTITLRWGMGNDSASLSDDSDGFVIGGTLQPLAADVAAVIPTA
jgi:hypothetical protein